MTKKENLSQRTADVLRQMIVQKQTYQVGQKLPNENDLSAQLGISRTTLREAIRILVSEGLLYVERGNGTFVSSQMDVKTDPQLDIHAKKITLRDLYEARMIIEPEAAVLACKRATQEDIDYILKVGKEVQEWILKDPTSSDRIEVEAEFHSSIVRACHNDFLAQFTPIIKETIEKTFDLHLNLDVIAEDAYKEHILIMDFLKRRDAQALKSAVTIHLHHAILHEEISINN